MESFFELVRDSIGLVEARMRSQTQNFNPQMGLALEHLLASGGKRIRPTLSLLTGRMLSADIEKVVTLAASVELLHTATLVHDDLIDGALLRRGKSTLNARWNTAATVLTGDFLFSRAARLAAELDSPAALRVFADTLATIVNGEITQMFNSRGRANREDYTQRIYAKTASLFKASTITVALLTPVDGTTREQIGRFGHEIGMAFQIVDDILDFTGEQATVGKPVASDLRQGLVTLPTLNYLEQHPDDPDIRRVLNAGLCDDDCFERLLNAIRQSGAIQTAMDEARQYVARGIAALKTLPDSPERQALIDLAEYIVKRQL